MICGLGWYNIFWFFMHTLRGDEMDERITDKWINIDEAADYLGIKPVTLRSWLRNGKEVPAHKIGKQWKFKRSELDEWVKRGESAIE